MGKMTAGKVLECTAAQAAWAAGGTSKMAGAFGAFCHSFGVAYRATDEDSAARRGSELYMAEVRLNNGRGEVFGDCVMQSPICRSGNLLAEIPVSLKGGDSRDISTDVPFIRSAVAAGMPLWVYLLDGEAEAVEYTDGVRVDVEPARNLTMRRINITPLLADCISDWSKPVADTKALPAFIREAKVGKYTYLRVRVNWNSVPARYWHDTVPVPFDAGAPLPSPWV